MKSAFLGLLGLWIGFALSFAPMPAKTPIIAITWGLEEGLSVIGGNSLLPMSYLPYKPKVLGAIVNPETLYDYCNMDYLKNHWPTDLAKEASAICYCESQSEWWRVNDDPAVPEYSVGLFQINLLVHLETEEDMKDPVKNIKKAVEIYKQDQWWAWENCGLLTGIIKK